MSWGAIKLRYRDSKNVFFDGEASPAPGGGSTPDKTYQHIVTFAEFVNGSDQVALDFTIPAGEAMIYSGIITLEAFDDSGLPTGTIYDDTSETNAISKTVTLSDPPAVVGDVTYALDSSNVQGTGAIGQDQAPQFPGYVNAPLSPILYLGGSVNADGSHGQVLCIVKTVVIA